MKGPSSPPSQLTEFVSSLPLGLFFFPIISPERTESYTRSTHDTFDIPQVSTLRCRHVNWTKRLIQSIHLSDPV